MQNKKGAMFGLDARIALAIFCIMSITVGLESYKILSDINIEKVLAESSTIGTAVEDYQKTMNKSIFDTLDGALSADAKETAAFNALHTNANLQTPYDTKWNGPYLKSSYVNNTEPYLNTQYRLVRLSENANSVCNDTKENPCYVFLKFKDITDKKCDKFEEKTTVNNYGKVFREVATECNILINIALDY